MTSPSRPSLRSDELAWAKRSTGDIARFLQRRPLVARDPHAELVLLESAALLWEQSAAAPSWAELPIPEIFRRLSIEQGFFADPARVVAYYEVLHAFVAWLGEEDLVGLRASDALVDQLMRAKTPLVEEARRVLRARREALQKQGAWHEVLRTMGG